MARVLLPRSNLDRPLRSNGHKAHGRTNTVWLNLGRSSTIERPMSIYFLSPSPSRSPLDRIQRVRVIAFPRHGPMVAELHPWRRHRQRAARPGPRSTNHRITVLRDATDSTNPTEDLPEREMSLRRASTADSGPRRRHDLGDEFQRTTVDLRPRRPNGNQPEGKRKAAWLIYSAMESNQAMESLWPVRTA
jgi:hypothetical protein